MGARLSVLVGGVRADREFIDRMSGKEGRPRLRLVQGLLMNPGIRAAALMRLAAAGGLSGKLARNVLIALHATDVTPGCRILGGLYLPHPVAIVVGAGAVLERDVVLYQGVTIGANSRGEYPIIGAGAVLYPRSSVVGKVTVGQRARIGAGVTVYRDVDAGAVVRG